MPRHPKSNGKTKAPAEIVTYQQDPALAEIGGRLIRMHPAHFGHLANFKVAYVMVIGQKPPSDGKLDKLATARKAPPLWAALAGFDAVVTVLEKVWRTLNPNQQEALIAHELSHLDMSEKGTLRLARHDLEEFAWIARHYGAWLQDVKWFDEQLALFEPGLASGEPKQGVLVPYTQPTESGEQQPQA